MKENFIEPIMLLMIVCVCIYVLYSIVDCKNMNWCDEKKDKLVVLVSCITAVSTFLAFFFAYRAYNESRKLRRMEAFSEIFTQLIGNYKDIFEKECLKQFIIKDSHCKDPILYTTQDKTQDTFYNFCSYFEVAHDQCKNLCDLCDKWDNYVDSITSTVQFSHCFKYLYHEIETVLCQSDKVLKDKDKRHYIGIVQSYLNYDELFCYLINLMQHFHRVSLNNEDDVIFQDAIKNYGFFNDLEHEKKYANIINNLRNADYSIDKMLDKLINF